VAFGSLSGGCWNLGWDLSSVEISPFKGSKHFQGPLGSRVDPQDGPIGFWRALDRRHSHSRSTQMPSSISQLGYSLAYLRNASNASRWVALTLLSVFHSVSDGSGGVRRWDYPVYPCLVSVSFWSRSLQVMNALGEPNGTLSRAGFVRPLHLVRDLLAIPVLSLDTIEFLKGAG